MQLTFFAILCVLCSIAAYYLIRSMVWTLPVSRLAKCFLSLLVLAICAGFPINRAYGHAITNPLLNTALLCTGAMTCYLVTLGVMRDVLLVPLILLKKNVIKARMWGGALVLILSLCFTTIGYHQAYDTKVVAVSVPLASTNPALANLCVVQLSDIHVTEQTPKAWLKQIVAQTNALQPDIICITGDIADLELPDKDGHMAPLTKLRARYGIYYVDGNHEYIHGQIFAWRQFAGALGFTLLHNRHVSLEHEGARIQIAGIPDSLSGQLGAGKGDVARALHSEQPHDLSILLSHRSQAIFDAPEQQLDLVLAGHTHGGQFFPWNIIVALAQPHLKGLYQEGARQVYVNQGTGFWAIPNRLGTQSEITLIRFIPQS
ncbi:MAG: metallophosphoesterase [Akkermansia sp.]